MDSDGRKIMKSAFDNLTRAVTPQDLRDFKDTTLEDVWKAARQIEREQGKRSYLQNMRRIEPALETLGSYAKCIEVFCQGFPFMSFVWGPIKFILLLARQHVSVMEEILEAYKNIAAALPRIDTLKAAFGNDKDFQLVLGSIYSDLLEFHHQAYSFFKHRAWHFCFTFHWGLFKRRFQCIIASLISNCELADKQASAIHFLEMKKKRDLERLENDEYEKRRRNQLTQDVLLWLSADDDSQEDFLRDLADVRQPRTCNWILTHPQVRPWLQEENGYPLIWMTGIPGAGKTVLCSLVIQHLQRSKSHSTLYYFCSQGDMSNKGCSQALRTLAVQLLRQNEDLVPLVHQNYYQNMSNQSIHSLKKMLKELLSGAKNVYLILDGVDECNAKLQGEILMSIVELQNHCVDSCKVMVSSRDEPQIRKCFGHGIGLSLSGNTDESLRCYIQHNVKSLHETFPDLETSAVGRIEDKLNLMAKGMFLWVQLVITMLKDLATQHELETYIETLPDGLDKAYGRILARIDKLSTPLRERAFRILFWTCAGLRPVMLEEVVDGIALKIGQVALSKATRVPDVQRDVLDLCAPLLQTRQGIVEMVHFSAKQYLLSEQSGPFVQLVKAHLNISISCLLNLTASLIFVPRHSKGTSQQDRENLVIQGAFGLQGYAQRYWADHVMAYFAVAEQPDDGLVACLNDFYQIRKDGSHISTAEGFSGTGNPELHKLSKFPRLAILIQEWLRFRKDLRGRSFDSVDAQQKWQCLKDDTYLSLIEQKIASLTEDICAKSATEIPQHINKQDLAAFKARLGSNSFSCRYFMCSGVFATLVDRETHENRHSPSFPCLECDFTERGFRSHRDLQRHKHKYHMSAQDFEICDNVMNAMDLPVRAKRPLEEAEIDTSVAKRLALGRLRWNTKGVQALQTSLSKACQALENVNHKLEEAAVVERSSRPCVRNLPHQTTNLAQSSFSTAVPDALHVLTAMKQKVEQQGYQCFEEFKSDVCDLAQSMQSQWAPENSQSTKDAMSLCAEALERPLKAFPDLINVDFTKPLSFNRPSFESNSWDSNLSHGGGQLEGGAVADSVEEVFLQRPIHIYWSRTEEEEFPRLLDSYGHDFERIANFFQTKTVDDVQARYQALVGSGKIQALEKRHQSSSSIAMPGLEKNLVQDSERPTLEVASSGSSAAPWPCQAEGGQGASKVPLESSVLSSSDAHRNSELNISPVMELGMEPHNLPGR